MTWAKLRGPHWRAGVLLALTTTFVLLVCGCADLRGTFAAMFELQSGIARTFGEPNTAINIANEGDLTVAFVNSPFAALPESERALRAAVVARYVMQHWPKDRALRSVSISFKSQSGVPGLSFTSTTTPYAYTKDQLDAMARDTLSTADSVATPDSIKHD